MKQLFDRVRSFSEQYPWFWRNAPYAVITGIFLALIVIVLIPNSACIAGCGARDKWCNYGNCSPLHCKNGNGLNATTGCSWDPAGGVCGDVVRHNIHVACLFSDNCNVSGLQDHTEESWRLTYSNGRSYWNVGYCDRKVSQSDCTFEEAFRSLSTFVNCCKGGGGGGGGGGCTPDYTPPVIHADQAAFTPPYPLVDGQDPDHLGVAVTVTAEGGQDKNHCGGGQAKITDFRVTQIDLAQSSRDWILNELSVWYPNATILGDYPMMPDSVSLSGKGSTQATLWFHFTPLDPGYYEVTVAAKQDKGNKTSTAVIKVPVTLLQTTIIR